MSEKFEEFWFPSATEPNTAIWFSHLRIASEDVVREFEALLTSALDGSLDDWMATAAGKVSLVVLCSQIPRLLYLGTPRIFCGDKIALSVAKEFAFSAEAESLPLLYQYFLLEPLYYSEDIVLLTKATEKLDQLIGSAKKTFPDAHKLIKFLEYRKTHFAQNKPVLEMFGRYPHRNVLLGRTTTLEETLWLTKEENIFLAKLLEPTSKPKVKPPVNETEDAPIQKRRRLRILAFHGMKQNSVLFRSRTRQLRIAIREFAEIVYVGGPHQYQAQPNASAAINADSITEISSVASDARCWWHTVEKEDGTVEYQGLEDTVQFVDNIFNKEGPFDGILGFSQGAALSGILAAIQPRHSIKFSFMIEISGFAGRTEIHRPLFEQGITGMPSLHIYGLADTLISPERTQKFAECFSEPSAVVSKHEGTHFAPNKWPLNDIATFVREQHQTITQKEVVQDYSEIHEPLKGLDRKIEATTQSGKASKWLPVGLNLPVQQFLHQNNKWTEILSSRSNTSFASISELFQDLVSSDVKVLHPQAIAEDLLVISWSLRSSEIEQAEESRPFFYALVAMLDLYPEETLSIIEEIPERGSWKDLCQLLVVVREILQPQLEHRLFERLVFLFTEQLKQDHNAMNQLLSNKRFATLSVGQLQEEGLWPSKCGEEAPRVKSHIGREFRLPQAIAKELNPLHYPSDYDPNDPKAKEALRYTKGICYSRYQTLVSSLKKIRRRGKKEYFEQQSFTHKTKVMGARVSEEGWKELLDTPVSSEIMYPRPQPVIPCELEQLDPLLDWLQQNEIPTEQTAFTKGTIVPDGRLDLCKQVVGPKGIDPLLCSMKGNEQVKRLLLGNNIVGDEGAKSIAKAIEDNSVPNMDTWYIAGNNISEIGIKPVCEALYPSTAVKALWLKRNPLLPAGVKHVAGLLQHNTSIVTLDLDNCGVLDEGVKYLVEGLKKNSTLLHLYLGVNGITPEGVSYISDYLAAPSSKLDTLFLSVNRVGDEGCAVLGKMFETNVNLRRLSLASNRISDVGVESLVSGLLHSKHPLELLDLGFTKSTFAVREIGNRICNDGAKSLARLLESNTTLRSLFLLNNSIEDEGLIALGKALESNSSLTSLGTTQFYSNNDLLAKHILHRVQANKAANPPEVEDIDLPEHVREIYSVYRTKSAAQQPFLHKFNWLQAADLDVIPDQ